MPTAMEYAESPLGSAIFGAGGGMVSAKIQAKHAAIAADKANVFSERMRDTQMQARAKDLEAAGFNRLLALGDPAASPTGIKADVPDFSRAVSSGISSALGTRIAGAQKDVLKTQSEANAESAKLAREKAITERFLQDVHSAQASKHLVEALQTGWQTQITARGDARAKANQDFWRSKQGQWKPHMDAGMSSAHDFLDLFRGRRSSSTIYMDRSRR